MSISLPAGFKYHAIMSYSWVQKPIVVEIHNFLTANGLKLWRDDRQVTGSVDGSIVEGIQDSKLMLVCMSRDYEQSESAQKELNFAESEKKPLIQIRLDNGPYPKTKFKVGSDDSLYFDFTDLSKKESTMGALFKEIIRTIGVSADQADVDPATAQDVFQNALAGDANAMEIVASNFYFEREFKKAFEWFSRAASLGNLKAEYNVRLITFNLTPLISPT
ncbi:cytokinesis protein 3 [Rhizoclosmatium hyalinum]|nr:cytokinesis protein 3 [Rhizoclosmatium hyalinum]